MTFKTLVQPSSPPLASSAMNSSQILQTSNSASAQNIGTIDEEATIPTVTLSSESISDVMAARLTTCLLGHVLYLKSQVPLYVDCSNLSKILTDSLFSPVAQLFKMV